MGSSIGRVDQVLGIDGGVLTAADLPPRNLKRWIARRKAEIVAAVEGGLLGANGSLRPLQYFPRRILGLVECL